MDLQFNQVHLIDGDPDPCMPVGRALVWKNINLLHIIWYYVSSNYNKLDSGLSQWMERQIAPFKILLGAKKMAFINNPWFDHFNFHLEFYIYMRNSIYLPFCQC